ncbi:MAG: response regulator, partial [Candidatus Omnitrophica bacterium]|nr:response regulator [Candidatus Omnitrophota bacterium]
MTKKKLLIIDDDPLITRSLEKYLRSSGYEVQTAQSGQEALEKVKRIEFDLIISDIRMPELDGMETLRRIRELTVKSKKERIPAIIITAYAGEDDVFKTSGELGITDLLYKPFELEEFIQVIERNLKVPPKPKEILFDDKLIEPEFLSLTHQMERYLQQIKNKFDEFDRLNNNPDKQIEFIEKNKKEIFKELDIYFEKTWNIVKNLPKERYLIYQKYYQQKLGYLLLDPIETNRHVYRKPLGYPGDYIMMNYIYDYHGNKNYLGNSSYEKLINNYTCNIAISCSNIKRKEFLKEKIIETLNRKDNSKILSVACGPARELIELLKENRIDKPLVFTALDFEKRALEFIKEQIDKIERKNRRFLSIEYLCRDITSIIRDKTLKEKLKDQDLIYAFGIFDYLSERMASRLTRELFQLLRKEAKLIICNVSLKNSSHRAYYELLGEWNMVHRTKEEMLKWTEEIKDSCKVEFEEYPNCDNYLFLC